MKKSAIGAAVLLVACKGSPAAEHARAEPSTSAAPPAAVEAAAPAAASASPPALSPTSGLAVVVEGRCPELGVSFLDNATMVHYGHVPGMDERGATRLVLAFVREDGALDEDPKLGRGLMHRDLDMTVASPLDVGSMEGSWPDHAFLTLLGEGGERVGSFSEARRWTGDHWQEEAIPRSSDDPSRISWMAGSRLVRAFDTPAYPSFTVDPPGAAPAPDLAALHVKDPGACIFNETAVVARSSGELFVAGDYCGVFPSHEGPVGPADFAPVHGEAGVARWAPGSRARIEAIPPVAHHADLVLRTLLDASPTALYLFGTVRNPKSPEPDAYLAVYDGTAWSRVETPYQGSVSHHDHEADGTLWVYASHALFKRAPDGAWTKQPLVGVVSVLWADGHPTWALTAKTLAHRGGDGQWSHIDPPRPAFSSGAELTLTRVSTSPKGDVWVNAAYEEKRPEWTASEKREALLRLGATRPAAHCDVAMGSSFSSWPPPATAACTDTVAILARVSKSAPKGYDFPQTRAALRGHTEIEGTEFVEIEIDGKRLLAAKVRSLDVGNRLVEIVSHGVRGTRPELVCTRPKVTRTIPLDLGTGATR